VSIVFFFGDANWSLNECLSYIFCVPSLASITVFLGKWVGADLSVGKPEVYYYLEPSITVLLFKPVSYTKVHFTTLQNERTFKLTPLQFLDDL
jgi:hypothetical protein